MLERDFQKRLIKEIKELFSGCFVLKNDGSNTPQGFPDILIIYKNKWAALECKRNGNSHKQANQEHYISALDDMSFARFICPENKEVILDELKQAFGD
jgi:Holliday junction resolvase